MAARCSLGLSMLVGDCRCRAQLRGFPLRRLQQRCNSILGVALIRRVCRESAIRCVQAEKQAQEDAAQSGVIVPHEDFGEVKRILAERVVDREMQYLIEWQDDHPNTWEPVENIASDVLADYVNPWWNAVKKADESKLMELLEDEGRDVNAVDDKERTALLYAAGLGSENVVRLLVEAGADIDWQDQDGFTPLLLAAGYVQPGIVKLLLELGADPEVQDSRGRTPLRLVQELLQRIPGGNPMNFAKRLSLDRIAKLLDAAMFEVVGVEQVLDKRMAAGNRAEYLVKWSDGAEDSWLPASEVAEDLVKDYEAGLEYGIAEKILDKRIEGDAVEYLVKWEDSEQNSWEPKENVDPELVAEYEASLQPGN